MANSSVAGTLTGGSSTPAIPENPAAFAGDSAPPATAITAATGGNESTEFGAPECGECSNDQMLRDSRSRCLSGVSSSDFMDCGPDHMACDPKHTGGAEVHPAAPALYTLSIH